MMMTMTNGDSTTYDCKTPCALSGKINITSRRVCLSLRGSGFRWSAANTRLEASAFQRITLKSYTTHAQNAKRITTAALVVTGRTGRKQLLDTTQQQLDLATLLSVSITLVALYC